MSEAKNTLQSKSYAQILDLISEGEIEGLVDGLRSIYLDDTPIMASDGTYNFSEVQVITRNGTNSQSCISGFPLSQKEVSVSTEIKKETPVVRTIQSSGVNSVYISISTPQLYSQDSSSGDISGSEIQFVIEVNSNGSGYVQVANDYFIGKCTSKYIRSYCISLSGSGPWDIRVRRLTADSSSSLLQNKLYFESYTEVVESKLRFPNSALAALTVNAETFSSIPTRSYDVKLLKIKVPSNYNPTLRTYSGTWDGTFQTAWSNNPAWVFYDVVTNSRFGLGDYISEDQVDKWSLYSIAKYCDQLIDNGFGSLEPRFTCNCYLQTRSEAYNLLSDLAGLFNSIVFWASGSLTLSQDYPKDAIHLFTPSNVVNGEFQYQGSSQNERYNVILVAWNDPDDGYSQKIEYIENSELIAKYGIIQKEITAFGCTSRGQAHRLGKWIIYSANYEAESVTFQTGIEGASTRPGQIIKIQDPSKAGSRLGGRVSSATQNQVVIDQELNIASNDYFISVMLPDGSIEDRQISSTDGNKVNVTSSFSEAPHSDSVWIVYSSDIEPLSFRVTGVSEVDSGRVYSISAVSYNYSKYKHIEDNISLEEKNYSKLKKTPAQPEELNVIENLYEVDGEVRVKAIFSWKSVEYASSYLAQLKIENGNLVDIGEISSNEVEILNIQPGGYTFYVSSLSALGIKSQSSFISKKILGKTNPPGDVKNFSLIPVSSIANLSWTKAEDLDVLNGGSVRIRFSSQDDASWNNSIDLVLVAGSASGAQVPLMAGTYLAKFIDSSGNASDNASLIITDALNATALNVVATLDESEFLGKKTNLVKLMGGIILTANTPIDQWLDVDSVVNFDAEGNISASGEYFFKNSVDLGGVYTSTISSTLSVSPFDPASLVDMRKTNIDEWLDFDGNLIDDVNAELYLRSTNDDPTLSLAEWTPWKKFFIGQYTARAYQFKLKIESKNIDHNILIKNLSATVDMPDRVERFSSITSNSDETNIEFESPFAAIPAIGITALNMSTGDRYKISNKSNSGFTITFYDSSGSTISRTFDVIATGYGRKIA